MSKASKARWTENQTEICTTTNGVTQHADVATAPLFAKVESITPTVATEWLKRVHEDNREASGNRVRGYANDMARGRWHLNGEAIKIDCLGRVIDGEHRLRAIVMAGVTVSMLVVYNAEAEGIDRGRTRSALDARRMRGETVSHLYIASLKILGRLHYGWHGGATTDEDTYDLERKHPKESAWLRALAGSKHRPACVIGAIAFTVPAIPLEATQFLEQIRSLENLVPGSPVLLFIRQLERMDTAGQANAQRIATLTLHALRAHVEGRAGSFLRPTDGSIAYWRRRLGLQVVS